MKNTLGIELGSTRIKAVLINEKSRILATGEYSWENSLKDGIWTYELQDAWNGLRECCRKLFENFRQTYGAASVQIDALGISAMMHGYLVFDKDGNQLVPFRTWRNTMTEQAAAELTSAFDFHIPQRWSIAHLYHAMLKQEPHIRKIHYMTTLSGYIHTCLTDRKVLGIGDASGMFPIDVQKADYNEKMLGCFNKLAAEKGYDINIREILPEVLTAGTCAGKLTEKGIALLGLEGVLEPGIPLCPPEGDAGSGMTATNSVKKRTGNVSAGTSIFGMLVLERPLEKMHPELDICMTPDGNPVAMAHCNNCSSDIDAWMRLFREVLNSFRVSVEPDELYRTLFLRSLQADADCGGLLSYNYYSGEHITGLEKGAPLFVRLPESRFTLADFMRNMLYSCFSTLKIGMDILVQEEKVRVDEIIGHGGIFKTPDVAQRYLALALDAPVTVMENAGEGGPWGMALLAMYMLLKNSSENLGDFLQDRIFGHIEKKTVCPDTGDRAGFQKYFAAYKKGLEVERAAALSLND